MPISATLHFGGATIDEYWGQGRPLKGFRIHAASNSVEVTIESAQVLNYATRRATQPPPVQTPILGVNKDAVLSLLDDIRSSVAQMKPY
jgi:hypothetical protein